jgi:hypothetical protein
VVAGSTNIIDYNQADPTASGEQMYYRAYMRMLGSAGQIQDLRVGSFNTGSGAFFAAVTLATTIYSGMPFEVHSLLSPAEKDRAIDGAIQGLRVRQEVPIWGTDSLMVYSLGQEILDVLDVRYFSDPLGSLSQGEGMIRNWRYVTTATGQEIRLQSAIGASQQLILDAILTPTLGAGDLATLNLLDDEVVLWGAAARCYYLMEADAPGQETAKFKEKRQEAAFQYSKLNVGPFVTRKIQMGQ